MPETKAQRSAAGRKAAATRKRHTAERKEHEQASAVDRTAELSDEVLKSLESGQRPRLRRCASSSTPSTKRSRHAARVRPGDRRSSTARWRWPTDWSTFSTTSSARWSRTPASRWADPTTASRTPRQECRFCASWRSLRRRSLRRRARRRMRSRSDRGGPFGTKRRCRHRARSVTQVRERVADR